MDYLLAILTGFNRLYFVGKRLFAWLLFLFSAISYSVMGFAQAPPDYRLAFYYGSKPSPRLLNQLKFYNNIVVEPSSGINPLSMQGNSRTVFAYVSLGEANNLNQYAQPINKNWIIAKNNEWQALVLDQSNPAWQTFFLDKVITPLWEKGYRGFFLDTLDSYRLASEDPKQMKKQQDGIIAIIRAIKTKYPDARLVFNRGFEIIPQLKSSVDEVVAESLFKSWDNKSKQYLDVSKEQREILLKELLSIKQMGIPVTVIDYLPPNEIGKAKIIAKQIADLGFNPWVTNGHLTKIYLFDFELIPRKILIFYQGKQHSVDDKIDSYASAVLAMPLNYMGYITILQNIAEPLPKNLSKKEYAGVVMAMSGLLLGREQELYSWYKTQIQKKIPLVIMNDFGFQTENYKLKPFGLSVPMFTFSAHTLKVTSKSSMIGYEISPVTTAESFVPIQVLRGTSLLRLEDETGTVFDEAAITPWGGYFLTNNYLISSSGDQHRWAINPFEFFKQALKLPSMPTPDTTTENGNRLMMVHIDGDGFANKGQWHKGPFAGEIMRKEFLEHYAIPTTASVIQGEIASNGLFPSQAPQLESLARKMFSLPYIEIASHTFSHPFNWHNAATYVYKGKKPNPYTLPIPNYRFNLYAEIPGSIDYINKNLAPPGKKCKVFLWSGDGDVDEEALRYTYQAGLANMNPGTLITKYYDSMSRVASLGLFEGPYFHAFSPIGNDNDSNALNISFYSLLDILASLKLTDKPHRLKPIDIYLHFFIVTQKSGIKALHAVYNWALSQSVTNIYISDFFNILTDFNNLLIAKKGDGWLFATNDFLRELRIPRSMGYPDLIRSKNVIGYSFYNDDCYIHLGPGGEALVQITTKPATIPFLMNSNVKVTRFIRKEHGIDFSLAGYLPPKFTFANMDQCTLWNKQEKIVHQFQEGNQKRYEFKKGTKYDLSIRCA